MNNRKFWIAALIWTAALLWVLPSFRQSQQPPPKPEAMLEQAQALEKAAGNDKGELKNAIKKYQKLVGTKVYRNTEYAAQARLHIGIIQETKLDQEQNAVKTYSDLVRSVSVEKSAAASEAQARLTRLDSEIDKKNSRHILYKVLDTLVKATGSNAKYSYALALLIITLVFKVVTTPLSHLQFKYMKEMQRIQPLVKELQAKYKNNQKEFGEKLMALYKEHGVNPFSSCLPILVQFPVLYLLYYMVRLYQFQFARGEFLWIGSSLAEKYPSIVGGNLAQPDLALLLIYTVSMFISQKLTIVDPTQAEQQRIMTYTMPIIFGVMFWFWAFPSAFMLYWLLFNIFSTTQQYMVLRQPTGTGGGSEGGAAGGARPVEPPKRPTTSPGKARRRRKRRFDAIRLPRLAWIYNSGS